MGEEPYVSKNTHSDLIDLIFDGLKDLKQADSKSTMAKN